MPVQGLRETRRILGPGGRLGTVTWAKELESKAGRIWTACLDAHGADELDVTMVRRHDLLNTPKKMEVLLRAAGFASIHAWADDLATRIELEPLLRLRTSTGSSKPRFDSLSPCAQEACLAAARSRMAGLPSEDFVARGRVVYAVASV